MKESYKDFLDTCPEATRKLAETTYKQIGDYDYNNKSIADIEAVILSLKPQSETSIRDIKYVVSAYIEYLGNNSLAEQVRKINNSDLYSKAKTDAKQRFVSYSDYVEMCKNINMHEDFNRVYYKSLVMSIYEGIYNDDLVVLKNLRASDVNAAECWVTVHGENEDDVYTTPITKELADNLIELGKIHTWERLNRYGTVSIPVTGVYPDSCFKLEMRVDGMEYYNCYYNRLRKMYMEYLGYSVSPARLYISGLMHRIATKLKERGFTLRDAFINNRRNIEVKAVIEAELKKSGNRIPIQNLRSLVRGNLDVFEIE